MRVLFDTSVLVPAVVDQLANHEAALDALLAYPGGEIASDCGRPASSSWAREVVRGGVPRPRPIFS